MEKMDEDVYTESKKKLECPFTWQMDESLALTFDNEMFVNIDDQPVKTLINSITLVYVHVIKKDLMTAYAKVKEMTKLWESMQHKELEKDGVSLLVLIHIIMSTRYHYYKERGNLEEAQKVMVEVPILDERQLRNKMNSATLNACKSLAWSIFFDAPQSIAVSYASKAVQLNPDCALWHFILGKKLKQLRRDDCNDKPLSGEMRHLIKSYELSNNQYFGIYVAQMYIESKNYSKANKVIMEIYNNNPQSIGIRLRLALSFMKNKNFELAKECLDFVECRCTDNSMYLHYKGIYFEKQKNYQMAALYYSKAAVYKNHKAELQFANCMMLVNKNFNYIQHLDNMVAKYRKSTILLQQLFLHIAMQFYFQRRDLPQALTYFLKAIQVNPKSKQLKSYKSITVDYKIYNIIDFIYDQEIPKIYKTYVGLPYDLSDVVEALEKLHPFCIHDGNELSLHVENMELL